MKAYAWSVKIFIAILLLGSWGTLLPRTVLGQEGDKVQTYVQSLEASKEGMSLWETIQSGGLIMWVLCGLSVVAVAIICYLFLHLNSNKLVPRDFTEKLIEQLEGGHENTIRESCKNESNAVVRIIMAGLNKKKRGMIFAKEAMENQVKREIGELWQGISYLADIAAVAPLIGLLGTVLGMIQAFNVIAFQEAVVKPILLAGGVSKAMVTTAGGLVVAIPVMLFYTYFRGKVQGISHEIETYGTDIIKIFEEMGT